MTKGRAISVLVLLAVLGTFGAVYQFYFKEKLEAYSQDQELLAALQRTYDDLDRTFSGFQPEELTAAWSTQRQPWEQAVEQRAAYFHNGEWYRKAARPPDNVPILRFWYGEEANRLVEDISMKMYSTLGTYPDIYGMLGVPRMEQWSGMNIPRRQVINSLGRLSFGISAIEMLMDAGATRINQVLLWPFHDKTHHKDLLTSRTIALSFNMNLENLVKMLEELRQSDQYWHVEALQIDYPYIGYQVEPQLQVQMLLTQAAAKPRQQAGTAVPGEASTGEAGALGSPGLMAGGTAQTLFQMEGFGDARARMMVIQEPGIFGKAWKWFKRYVLYTN